MRPVVTVLAKMDLKGLKFRKADGRNRNDVTIVAALFDRNGNYRHGRIRRLIEMRLKDETLAERTEPASRCAADFDVKPGATWSGWWCGTPKGN